MGENIKFYLIPTLLIVGVLASIILWRNAVIQSNPYAVYDINNGQAVYIANTSCTVNTDKERPIADIQSDLTECLTIHNMWMHLENSKKVDQ